MKNSDYLYGIQIIHNKDAIMSILKKNAGMNCIVQKVMKMFINLIKIEEKEDKS